MIFGTIYRLFLQTLHNRPKIFLAETQPIVKKSEKKMGKDLAGNEKRRTFAPAFGNEKPRRVGGFWGDEERDL